MTNMETKAKHDYYLTDAVDQESLKAAFRVSVGSFVLSELNWGGIYFCWNSSAPCVSGTSVFSLLVSQRLSSSPRGSLTFIVGLPI
jgi:hypothetical protein